MALFGKRMGGGRRSADRSQSVLPALVTTISGSRSAVVLDVSSTGARVRGVKLPREGSYMKFKVEGTEVYATVQWCAGELRGLAFDTVLTVQQIGQMRRKAEHAQFSEASITDRLALQEWAHGVAR